MSVEKLLEFRLRKDTFFASSQSPLAAELRQDFAGLKYFDPNPSLEFQVRLEPVSNVEHIAMETSSGVRKFFVRAGRLEFQIEGQSVQLTAYSNPETDDTDLFIPFRDATSGSETYGSGRYLDTELEPDGSLVLDFNLAYNPYCAYSDGWSCPIPPLENWLKVSVRAGEKTYGAAA